MTGWALVNGRLSALAEATVAVTDVGFTHGYSVFETMLSSEDHDPTENLERLARSAQASGIDLPPAQVLRDEIAQVRQKVGELAVVRITVTGDGTRVVTATPPESDRWGRSVRCITGRHVDGAFVDGSVKHRSRMGWMVAVRQAGVDEMLLVDEDGRFTEGTSCAVIAVIGGVVHTAPWDGRILQSTTLRRLLAQCERLGIEVVRRGPVADGPFDALYVASTTRGLALVSELDGTALPGMDPVGRRLS
ncbi:MAG: aminotransferase class IV [Myxococcales bacterium]|nr:aminotransferase class IV [Myxococcales bacterium]